MPAVVYVTLIVSFVGTVGALVIFAARHRHARLWAATALVGLVSAAVWYSTPAPFQTRGDDTQQIAAVAICYIAIVAWDDSGVRLRTGGKGTREADVHTDDIRDADSRLSDRLHSALDDRGRGQRTRYLEPVKTDGLSGGIPERILLEKLLRTAAAGDRRGRACATSDLSIRSVPGCLTVLPEIGPSSVQARDWRRAFGIRRCAARAGIRIRREHDSFVAADRRSVG